MTGVSGALDFEGDFSHEDTRKEGSLEAMKLGSWEKEEALRAVFKRLRR